MTHSNFLCHRFIGIALKECKALQDGNAVETEGRQIGFSDVGLCTTHMEVVKPPRSAAPRVLLGLNVKPGGIPEGIAGSISKPGGTMKVG